MQYRNTKQKTTILNAIDTYGHVTVEELKEILHNNVIEREDMCSFVLKTLEVLK